MPPRQHVVITGTGRTGTTFLVELLTHLGLDTGFSSESVTQMKDQTGRAGLEHDIRQENSPFIVKSPWFCDIAKDIIHRKDIVVEHIFIPIRELNAAAQSRRVVTEAGSRYGGLWHTKSSDPGIQEQILSMQVYKLMLAISDADIPVTLIRYPRLTKDTAYLYKKLKPVMKNIDYEFFCEKFNKIVRPDLVHSFNKNDC